MTFGHILGRETGLLELGRGEDDKKRKDSPLSLIFDAMLSVFLGALFVPNLPTASATVSCGVMETRIRFWIRKSFPH